MKKTFFKQFLALFLTGTMVAAVGCKDYDDDIDKLNDRLDDLSSTVELKADLSKIQSTLDKVNAVDFDSFATDTELTNAVKNFLTEAQIKTLVESYGYQTKANVQSLISGLQDKSQVEAIFKAMIAGYDTHEHVMSDIASELGKWSLTDAQIAQVSNALKNQMANKSGDFYKSISEWLGAELATYMTQYVKGTEFKTASASAAVEAINDQITNAQSTLAKKVQDMINASINKTGDAAFVTVGDLKNEFGDYTETVEALGARIAELENRIQSLVWVPKSIRESQRNTSYLTANPFLEVSDGDSYKQVFLTDVEAPYLDTLTFRVSPAKLAEKITAETAQILVEELPTRTAPSFTVESVKADATNGAVTMVVSTGYNYYGYDGPIMLKVPSASKSLAIALNVNIPGEGDVQGIDYTTSYIATEANGYGYMNNNLYIGYEDIDGEIVVMDGAPLETEMAYTNTEKHNFFEGLDLYVATRPGEYVLASEVFPKLSMYKAVAVPDAEEPANKTVVNNADHAANYELADDAATIKTSDIKLIDDMIFSAAWTFGAQVGEDYITFGDMREILRISPATKTIEVADMSVVWNYATAKEKKSYELTPVLLTNKPTKDEYNFMRALDPEDVEIEVKNAAGETVEFSTITLAMSSSLVSEDVNMMPVQLTLADAENTALIKGGVYSVTATFPASAQGNRIAFKFNLNVTGMPVIDDVTIEAAEFVYDGSYTFQLLKDYAKAAWKDNAAFKAAFKDEATFVGIINAITPGVATKNGKAKIVKNDTNLDVTFDQNATADYTKTYTPSIKFTDAAVAPVSVTFKTASVKLNDPGAELTPVDFYVQNGKATAITELNGETFKVIDKPLDGAYRYVGTLTNTHIDYSIDDKQFGTFKGVKPVIVTNPDNISDQKLVWNEWNQLSVTVTVKLLTADNTVLATTTFEVVIVDPVAAAITVTTKASISVSSATKTYDVVKELTLKETVDSKNTNIFDATAADGLNATLKTAFAGSTKYAINAESLGTLPSSYVTVDDSGLVTFTKDASLLPNDTTFKVDVTYTYQFGTRTAQVSVKLTK